MDLDMLNRFIEIEEEMDRLERSLKLLERSLDIDNQRLGLIEDFIREQKNMNSIFMEQNFELRETMLKLGSHKLEKI